MTYVLWGVTAGVIISLESTYRKKHAGSNHEKKHAIPTTVLQRIGVLLLFTLSSVLFRASTVADIGTALRQIFTGGGWSVGGIVAAAETLGMTAERLCFLLPAFGVMALLPGLTAGAAKRSSTYAIARRTAIYVFAVLAIAFCWLELLSASDVSSFQYFQF